MTATGFARPPAAEDVQDAEERQAAVRALLRQPLITLGDALDDELRLIRRHRVALTRFFAEALGYRLTVEPAGARLYKPGLGRDASRPLLRRSGAAFTPRAYALFTLTIAALTRLKSQLLVDELVAGVRSAAVEAEIDVDLDAIGDRRALHAALLELVRLGALSERDGDLEHWADKSTQSLLDVNRDVLGLLVSAPLGSIGSLAELLEPPRVPSAAGGARIAVRRRLVESPILSVDDLPEDHADWWSKNRNREREWFHDQLGLEVELRAEGALALDPAEDLSDIDFPGRGATSHLALLILEALVGEVRLDPGPVRRSRDAGVTVWLPVAADRVDAVSRALVAEWSSGLRRDQREDPGSAIRQALALLESVGLVRPAPDPADQAGLNSQAGPARSAVPAGPAGSGAGTPDPGWHVHAAAARYRPIAQIVARSDTGEPSLFDLGDKT